MSAPWLGIVADDVTGACDVAAAAREAGLSTVLRLGVPDPDEELPACACAVIGLGIRTVDPDRATTEATAAAAWLRGHGAEVLYQKYCSTFDSSPRGNIGPVADALTDLVGAAGAFPVRSVGTPATPAAGRTQYQGHLFVGDRLLSESSLRDHPLTPMRDPDLVRVLAAQTPHPVRLVAWETLRAGSSAVRRAVLDAADTAADDRPHVLLDALSEEDLDVLAEALVDRGTGRPVVGVVGGGAGLAGALARVRASAADGRGEDPADAPPAVGPGERLIVSGSCSQRTREQVRAFPGLLLALTPDDVAGGEGILEETVGRLRAAFAADPGRPVLVSSTAEPAEVRAQQDRWGRERAAQLVEGALGAVAARAVGELGVRRVLVAGGETSSAVTQALAVRSLHVGETVSPGVPWTTSTGSPPLALLLKSGNFGGVDLFRTAWEREPR